MEGARSTIGFVNSSKTSPRYLLPSIARRPACPYSVPFLFSVGICTCLKELTLGWAVASAWPGKRASHLPGFDASSFAAGIVFRVDVVELERRLSMNLDDGLAASHGIVVHVGIKKRKAAGREGFHLVDLKLVTHAKL